MKKGFNSKPHLICTTDMVRHHMNHVYFKGEYLYATDGYAGIKQHLSLHDFTPDEIALMDDKWIHRTVFPDLYKAEYLKVIEEGIVAVSKAGHESTFKWSRVDEKFPNIDKMLQGDKEEAALRTWAIDPNRLKSVYDAMVHDFKNGVKITFTGQRQMIIIEPTTQSPFQIAILMPMEVNEEFPDHMRGINHPLVKPKS